MDILSQLPTIYINIITMVKHVNSLIKIGLFTKLLNLELIELL